MTDNTTISTLDDLVLDYGGAKKMALRWQVEPHTVSTWLARKYIPPAYHLRMLADLKRRGRVVDPIVFGLSKEEFTPLQAC